LSTGSRYCSRLPSTCLIARETRCPSSSFRAFHQNSHSLRCRQVLPADGVKRAHHPALDDYLVPLLLTRLRPEMAATQTAKPLTYTRHVGLFDAVTAATAALRRLDLRRSLVECGLWGGDTRSLLSCAALTRFAFRCGAFGHGRFLVVGYCDLSSRRLRRVHKTW
jgi:hypothetical protein